jgi:hypothetical protein
MDENAWYEKQPKVWPKGKEHYNGGLDSVQKSVNLRDTKLQVIVKLANIVLTPDKPSYAGGKWHVEGATSIRGGHFKSLTKSRRHGK